MFLQIAPAQTKSGTATFERHLSAAKALLAQAPPNLLFCGDTGWQADRAQEQCREALKRSPENSDALWTMGDILFRKGMYKDGSARDTLFDESKSSYERALRSDPENSKAHEGLAQLLNVDLMQRMDRTLTQARMWMGIKRPLGPNDISPQARREFQTEIENAIRHAQLRLAADPKAIIALGVVAEVTRVKASLAENSDAFESDMRDFEEWYRKSRAIPIERTPAKRCDVGGVLGGLPSQAPPQ